MMGSAAAVVAEVAGKRHLIGMDKGHKLEIRTAGIPAPALVIESRPVTEFAAAVDSLGRLHVAAWLLSRHLMYYTSADGEAFTRSTLLKSDGGLRLKDCLIFADTGVSVVYVADTEYANTLVCYHYDGNDWEGRRIVEVDLPQRLTAWQFDGSPGGASVVYGVKDSGRTVVMSRPVSGDTAPEVIATINGSLSDFCALTSGGVRQACWLADGQLMINGLRQSEEPWSRTWPCLKRGEMSSQCLWLENGMISGLQLGTQRAKLRPAAVRDPLPCMLALPGELRKAIVDGGTLKETALMSEVAERQQSMKNSTQPGLAGKETTRSVQGDITLTDVVRNQAVYITRMQESVGAMERNMLRMQAEVNRLSKEISAVLRAKEPPARPEPQMRVAAIKPAIDPEQIDSFIEQQEAIMRQNIAAAEQQVPPVKNEVVSEQLVPPVKNEVVSEQPEEVSLNNKTEIEEQEIAPAEIEPEIEPEIELEIEPEIEPEFEPEFEPEIEPEIGYEIEPEFVPQAAASQEPVEELAEVVKEVLNDVKEAREGESSEYGGA